MLTTKELEKYPIRALLELELLGYIMWVINLNDQRIISIQFLTYVYLILNLKIRGIR